MSNEFGLNEYEYEYELEWAKRGGVIVASYSQENNGEGGSFNKSFLVKRLAKNVFIGAETLSEKGGFLAQESFEPKDIDDFYLVCMATREQCEEAGVEYIEPPVDVEPLKKRIDELEKSIKNLHKVKGRHHTQQAAESLFKLVGLENNIGEKNE